MTTGREILKAKSSSQLDVEDLVQGIFAAELLAPSLCLWVVSPWISDIAVIDNRTGAFDALEPSWGPRIVRLSELIALVARRGCYILVVTRPGEHNDRTLARIHDTAEVAGAEDSVGVVRRETLHLKGLLSDAFYLSGSMNFTHNGITLLEESVKFEVDPQTVAKAKLDFYEEWGGRLAASGHGD